MTSPSLLTRIDEITVLVERDSPSYQVLRALRLLREEASTTGSLVALAPEPPVTTATVEWEESLTGRQVPVAEPPRSAPEPPKKAVTRAKKAPARKAIKE